MLGLLLFLLGGWMAFGERLYRNAAVHAAVERLDPKDRSCQKAVVAAGSFCPTGCSARPPRGPEELGRPPECRSRLWVATCGADCAPRKGLVRLDDGRFVPSSTLIVRLKGPRAELEEAFNGMGLRFENGISGLYRYRVSFPNPEDSAKVLERTRSRLIEMEAVEEAAYAE